MKLELLFHILKEIRSLFRHINQESSLKFFLSPCHQADQTEKPLDMLVKRSVSVNAPKVTHVELFLSSESSQGDMMQREQRPDKATRYVIGLLGAVIILQLMYGVLE